ncbi:MAG TPA: DUF2138 family protein [Burkholderiaceae bacterium]|jgi:uncharacterized protein YfaA (DUF2138 family)|nr:DUF2138 family protein [Burkholderiaceae bacterium]
MRRIWIVVGLIVTAVAGAAAYQRGANWKEFHFPGSRLMVDLAHPDALIRTASLSALPRDLLKAPIARDVLTEDLLFYYEQNEDRLGINGAIKRIAYEHKLEWTDRILGSVLDEPAEVGMWRDGKGALRHYAIVMRRNAMSKVLQEAATVALKDSQLTQAGEIDTPSGKAAVMALEINPRRTLLLVAHGDRLIVLSDPGLLFDRDNKMLAAAQAAVASWLEQDGVLSKQFALDDIQPESPATSPVQATHTLVIGAPTLSLGYGAFLPGFKGLRFDYTQAWSTSVWLDRKTLPPRGMGDSALWQATPANPSACVVLPVDWHATQQVVAGATNKPPLSNATALNALGGTAMACWYSESTLYSPVFIARLANGLPDRNATLQTLASWALARKGTVSAENKTILSSLFKGKDDLMVWRGVAVKDAATPAVGARGAYVVFSPDGTLVDLALATIAHTNPSVADQMPVSDATLALITPQRLSGMMEREALAALSGPGDASMLAVAQTHLPPHMKALAAYPPYRLDAVGGNMQNAWQRVQWRSPEQGK